MADQETPIVFTGKVGEYFGIWIINLLLSIVTLGIYSAWAKVRRKKYFYHNTLIDGVGFDYHASPIAILKGRLIAFVLFVTYAVLEGSNPIIAGLLFLALIIALPWIITRALRFNARNSSHRGLRFDFDGQYGQAALVFLVFPLLIIVTLGLVLPFAMRQINKFMFDHHKFGASHFAMEAKIKDFYMVYLKLFGAILLLGVVLALSIRALMPSGDAHLSTAPSAPLQTATYQPKSVGGFMQVGLTEAPANVTQDAIDQALAAAETAEYADGEEYYDGEDYLKDLSPEERAQFEAEMEKLAKEFESDGDLYGGEPDLSHLGNIFSEFGSMIYGVIFLSVFIYAALLLSLTAYVKSRISNLVWNHTKLDHLSFHSNQRMRDLLWLYLSNMVVLIITLGLATPWAQIRMAKYRMEHLKILGENNWDTFVGEKKEKARALGEEVAEMFDVDLSFG